MRSNPKKFLAVFLVLTCFPTLAFAYVDPGLVSMAVQGMFAAFAGFVAIYVVGPWRWLKSLIRKKKSASAEHDEKEVV